MHYPIWELPQWNYSNVTYRIVVFKCGKCGRPLRPRSVGWGVVTLGSEGPGPHADGRVFSCHPRRCGFTKGLTNANVDERVRRAKAAGLDYVLID